MRRAAGWIAFSAILCSMSMDSIGWSQDPPTPLPIWTGTPPGDEGLQLPAELDQAIEKPSLVAGKNIQRIGNVSQPTLQVFKPPKDKDTGTSVVILPGGGYSIVAYDLEGTEVAQWLNTIGVTGIVVKYRVPARKGVPKWQAAVQDAQRAVRTARAHAKDWNIDPSRIGILGFSAGGDAAARTTLLSEAQYPRVDTIDDQSHRPNFSILIYPAYLYDEKTGGLVADLSLDDKVPPTFLVHAFNDPLRRKAVWSWRGHSRPKKYLSSCICLIEVDMDMDFERPKTRSLDGPPIANRGYGSMVGLNLPSRSEIGMRQGERTCTMLLHGFRWIVLLLCMDGVVLAYQEAPTSLRKQAKEALDESIADGEILASDALLFQQLIAESPADRTRLLVPSQVDAALDQQEQKVRRIMERWLGALADERFAMAQDSLQSGKNADAFRLCFETLALSPKHSEASKLLAPWIKSFAQSPVPSKSDKSFANALGKPGSYNILKTPHFTIASRASSKVASNLAEHCEQTYCIWQQLFFDIWCGDRQVRIRFFQAMLAPRPPVLFAWYFVETRRSMSNYDNDRAEHSHFNRLLQPKTPNGFLLLGRTRSISVDHHAAP